MTRLKLHQIDPAGGSPGQVPTISADGKTLNYATPSTGSGGGSTGGGVGRDRRWNPPTSATVIDEFNDDTLNAAWVRVDGSGAPASNVTWTEGADVISMVQSAGDTSGGPLHALMRPLATAVAVGDAFVIGAQAFTNDGSLYPTVGIVLADGTTFGSGNQVVAALSARSGNNDLAAQVWPYAGYNTRQTYSATTLAAVHRSHYIYLRLVKLASDSWRADISPDGVGWMTYTTPNTKVLTPTHVGLCATTFGQSGTKFAASFDFMRRYSGVS